MGPSNRRLFRDQDRFVCETINLSGKSSVKVSWFYDVDDEDMMEAGEDYSALVKIPFEMMKA